jgi:hypothetical protein
VTAGTAGIAAGSAAAEMPARSYGRILGANDRIGKGFEIGTGGYFFTKGMVKFPFLHSAVTR